MSNFLHFLAPIVQGIWAPQSCVKANFGEVSMAKYLRKDILDAEFDVLSADWMSGLGSVLGLHKFCPNCIERSHRTHKGLLSKCARNRDVAILMVENCQVVKGKVKMGIVTD